MFLVDGENPPVALLSQVSNTSAASFLFKTLLSESVIETSSEDTKSCIFSISDSVTPIILLAKLFNLLFLLTAPLLTVYIL